MGGMAAVQAASCILGSIFLAAQPAPAPLPLASRPQVEAAGLTIYWDRSIALQCDEHVLRISRVDDALYAVTNQGRAMSLDAATGVQRWTARVANPNIRISGPTHDANTAYFTTILGVVGVDRATGDIKLRWKGEFVPTGPVSSDGQILFGGDSDKRIDALQLRDMGIAWEFMTDGLVSSAPVLLGPNIYVVSEGGTVYGATKKDKTRLWQPLHLAPVEADPAVYGGNLYVGTMHQSLYCIDLAKGQQRWQARFPGPLSVSPKATSQGVYQPIPQFGVFCVDASNGHIRWTLPEGLDLLAEHENLVWLMTTRCSMVGCDRGDGQVRQEVPCRAEMWVANELDDAIFIASSQGQLMCIRPAGVPFLRYRTVMETTARGGSSSRPAASATQDSAGAQKPRPPVDYLKGEGAIPPVVGGGQGTKAGNPPPQ